MKSWLFNCLLMIAAVSLAYLAIRALPDTPVRPATVSSLNYRTVAIEPAGGPLNLAGAWDLSASDRRFGGISALAIDGDLFLAVGDRGAVARFNKPSMVHPALWVADLREGPGPWGEKWSRDAESLAPDPAGRGWWVGFEQNHSLYLFDNSFSLAIAEIGLDVHNWPDNRGAEGLLADDGGLLVAAENGRKAVRIGKKVESLDLRAGADVAEAAEAPDGSLWLLLRSKGLGGIRQSIAPLIKTRAGYRVGRSWPVPKGPLDNFEGMAIEAGPSGGWRFWLISDDGHRIMARTLLVALDYRPPGHDKSPATSAGLSK